MSIGNLEKKEKNNFWFEIKTHAGRTGFSLAQ